MDVNGVYKPTYNWGAPHCRWNPKDLRNCIAANLFASQAATYMAALCSMWLSAKAERLQIWMIWVWPIFFAPPSDNNNSQLCASIGNPFFEAWSFQVILTHACREKIWKAEPDGWFAEIVRSARKVGLGIRIVIIANIANISSISQCLDCIPPIVGWFPPDIKNYRSCIVELKTISLFRCKMITRSKPFFCCRAMTIFGHGMQQ